VSTDLRSELLAIRSQYGTLADRHVVTAAREPSHPLHSRFEWDDSAAGEAYRLHQARELIRSVRIAYREADESGPAKSVRAFVSVPSKDGYAYDPAEEVREDPFRSELVLRAMEREWKALYRRYREFEEFVAMVRQDVGGADSAAA
jgi:hypothetical protein